MPQRTILAWENRAEMNDDVRKTMEEQAAALEAAAAVRAEITANWRRLLHYRNGLAGELERLGQGRLEESFERLLAAKLAGEPPDSAGAKSEAARAALAAHRGAGVMARLSPAWHLAERRLAAAASTAEVSARAADAARSFRANLLQQAAAAEALGNRAANQRSMRPHQELSARLAGTDLAISTLRRGNEAASACLRRWDLDALLKVADISRKLDTYGSVAASEWAFYCSGGRALPEPSSFGTDIPGTERMRQTVTEEGSIVRLRISPMGSVSGILRRAYDGIAEGTDLGALGTLRLAELLGRMHMDSLATDADLLEAYLDATAPSWREQAAEAMRAAEEQGSRGGKAASTLSGESPYDVLGVTPDMEMADIGRAFAEQMQIMGKLPNSAPQRRLIEAFKAIRAVNPVRRDAAAP